MNRPAETIADHFLYGVSDLHKAAADFELLTGVSPAWGGIHEQYGTANYLVSIGAGTYLEIIGPEPNEEPHGLGIGLAGLARPKLFWFATAMVDADKLQDLMGFTGLSSRGPIVGSRKTTSGQMLRWQTVKLLGHDLGGFVPFLINWGASQHPAAAAPAGIAADSFRIQHPDADQLRSIYEVLGCKVAVATGPPSMTLCLATPKGKVDLFGDGALSWFDDPESLANVEDQPDRESVQPE